MNYSLGEIAEAIGAELSGDPDITISGIATIKDSGPSDLTFLDNPAYRKYLSGTKAAAVILSKEMLKKCPTRALIVNNPYYAYAKAVSLFKPKLHHYQGIHPTAVIASSAEIGADVSIGPHVVIEPEACIESGVKIGANSYIGECAFVGQETHLYPNVTLYHDCRIGNHCIVHSGTVIGSDGFGLAKHTGKWHMIEQVGRVIIGNHVLIGACSSIDRGALSDTVLKDGVKIDNQVQIGHNVVINEHTVVSGCSAIAGSTEIGEHCIIGGDVAISGHLKITNDVSISGGTRIYSRIDEPGIYSSGMPVQKNKEWHKTYVRLQQLDKLAKTVKTLEKKVAAQRD